jgi:hypothetical protein
MAALHDIAIWIDSTRVSGFITDYRWIWPGSEIAHFIGLTLLIGIVGALDLRVLGFARQVAVRTLHQLVPWSIAGFAICLVTGLIFFIAEPTQYIASGVFWLKMLFIVLAGLNVGAFYLTGVYRSVEELGPGERAPLRAQAIAFVSLFLWVGVLVWGRMLPFLGTAF